jgi:hypothetical protein
MPLTWSWTAGATVGVLAGDAIPAVRVISIALRAPRT